MNNNIVPGGGAALDNIDIKNIQFTNVRALRYLFCS